MINNFFDSLDDIVENEFNGHLMGYVIVLGMWTIVAGIILSFIALAIAAIILHAAWLTIPIGAFVALVLFAYYRKRINFRVSVDDEKDSS